MLTDEEEADADRQHRASHWAPYRAHMVTADQKSQEDFDKTVLSLSGGALGISFVFLKDVIGTNPILSPNLLLLAWIAWGSSTLCVLLSYYLSHQAIRKIIRQIDNDSLHLERPGGRLRDATAYLNAAGALLFVLGVLLITLFANANLKEGRTNDVRSEAKSPATTASAASAAAASSAPTPAAASSAVAASAGKR